MKIICLFDKWYSNMRNHRFILVAVLLGALFLQPIYSQDEATRTEMEQILGRFSNYRFGNISIFRLKNIGDIRKALKLRQEKAAGVQINEEILKTVEQAILKIIEDGVLADESMREILQAIDARGFTPPEQSIMEQLYQYYKLKHQGAAEARPENAYLITTRAKPGEIPEFIIALIISYNASGDMEKQLKSIGPGDIYTYDEMKNFQLDTTFSANNLYDLMVNALVQRNVENKTIEAQGIGNAQWFARKIFGNTETPFLNEADLSSYDVQKILRVSEGEPFNFGIKQNELILSPDWILWRRFPQPGYYDEASGKFIVDTTLNSNSDLPLVGLELKYGIDCINYTSFFSERVTLSALWQNVKLGLILPTDGWASIGKNVFDINRKLTYAGFGLAGSFDFPIKVIPKSGVFHFDFGYVLGDAKESKYKSRNIDTLTYTPWRTIANRDFDYLIRGNIQAYYTFGVQIDNNYLFRFGLGGTFYQVEQWYYDLDTANLRRRLVFKKYDEKSVGDVSIRVDFMSTDIATPFGANVQYFNGGIGGGVWLQVPIIRNTLYLRLDGRGYFVPFKDKPDEWENKGYFIPMARFILTF
ncbi:hypothetical protein D9V87_02350 [Bacteroidetes/Chlorobi group bacterium MS-B_bin-24]|nr:MAG: hypothetical protein D9V87_02350 [Bacteroidetes/Chlorobi group bacterium MS-B_bin-24]